MATAAWSTRRRDESVTRTAPPTGRVVANNPFGPRAIHNGVLLVDAFGKVRKKRSASTAGASNSRLMPAWYDSHFEHAADPARGQVDLALDDIRAARTQTEFLLTHRELRAPRRRARVPARRALAR